MRAEQFDRIKIDTFGRWFRLKRENEDYSVLDITNMSNIPEGDVLDIESGKRLPSLEEVEKLLWILDIELVIDVPKEHWRYTKRNRKAKR